MPEWEDIAIPAGSFIGWGSKKGQHVTGKVIDYQADGGTDFNQNPCPQIVIELTEQAASFNKEGDRNEFPAGDIVQITCGQVKLKQGIRAADPTPGDIIKIELTEITRLANGNTMKTFGIKIARGVGAAKSAPKAAASVADDDDEPPF